MSSLLKIQNFGPITSGYDLNDGYLSFPRFTVLCGDQCVGKSCVAKLWSMFSWIEKALVRGDFKTTYIESYNRFVRKFCAFHNIEHYFKPETYLHYKGQVFDMEYKERSFKVAKTGSEEYHRPKVIYVPAERNLISVVERAENIKGLPESLSTFLADYRHACRNMEAPVSLPLEGTIFKYDKLNGIASVEGEGYALHLNETSSGLQSLTPMFVVLNYFSSALSTEAGKPSEASLKETETIRRRIEEILLDDSLDPYTRRLLINRATAVANQYMLAVIEEPEENLYPASQRGILNSLTAFANEDVNNQVLVTTHSPYIINYLSLAIKAKAVSCACNDPEAADRLHAIVPRHSQINGEETTVYEVDNNGAIHLLPKYDGMPSDDNYLNQLMQETNILFNSILDIAGE